MTSVTDMLAEEPMVLLGVVLAVGAIIGAVRIRGISIGPAGALFAGLAASALDDRLVIPSIVGVLGLSLFTYAIGVSAGPALADGLGSRLPLLGIVAVTLAALAPVARLFGSLFGLSLGETAGLYAGSLTNTPALAAAQALLPETERGEPVVGYALAYPYGVLGMLAAIVVAARVVRPAEQGPDATELRSISVRITGDRVRRVRDLPGEFDGTLRVSRIDRGDSQFVPEPDDELRVDDVVVVICPDALADAVVGALGERSKNQLTDDRSRLDFRRMVVSNDALVGRSIGSLDLTGRFGATITRIRRGDTDQLADGDTVLEPGDRVRVVAPPAEMATIARELGDDERHVAEFHPRGFTIGLLLGLLVGIVPVPVPGVGTVELGSAGGPLVVGLLLGWRERTGPFVWQVPHGVAQTLRQLGSLLFLGMAGTSGGAALRSALSSGDGYPMIAGGLVITSLSAAIFIVVGVWQRLGPAGTAGLVSGAQTQPAALAFAAERTSDPRLDLTYALVLPVAMVTKIVAAQLLVLI